MLSDEMPMTTKYTGSWSKSKIPFSGCSVVHCMYITLIDQHIMPSEKRKKLKKKGGLEGVQMGVQQGVHVLYRPVRLYVWGKNTRVDFQFVAKESSSYTREMFMERKVWTLRFPVKFAITWSIFYHWWYVLVLCIKLMKYIKKSSVNHKGGLQL